MMKGFGAFGPLLLSQLPPLLLLLLCWAEPGQAAEVVYDWKLDAVLRNDLSPDCMDIKNARRGMFLVVDDKKGPQFPGPLVEANEGDTIRVSTVSSMCACCQMVSQHSRCFLWDRDLADSSY
jgi:hypothetical protein